VTALALHLHDTGQPPIAVSALMLAGLLPLVLLGPVAGSAVDRFETTALLRIVLAAQAVLAAALAFASPLWTVLALVFALGTGTAVTQSGVLALLPTLTPTDRLVRANGWLEAFRSVGVTLGPPLGGVLAGIWGARGALLVDAATFAVLCGALWLVPASTAPARTAEPDATRGRPAWRALVEGVGYIARDRQLRFAVVMLTAVTFFLAGVSVVEVYFARDTLRTGAVGYGALVGAWGVGMMFGALGTARWVPATGLVFVLVGVGPLAGAAVIVAAVFPVLPIALTGWLVGGVTNGAYHVAMRSLLHRRTSARLHGRVFAAQFAAYNAAKVASMVTAGPVVALLQPRATILVMGIGAVATGVVGTAWLATRRVHATEERS
jgi:MFS family permease